MHFALTLRRLIAVLSIAALAFTAACSSSDDDDATDADDTTEESNDRDEDRDRDDDRDDDDRDDDGDVPLDLDDLLPGDDALPADYTRQAPSLGDDEGGMSEELESACPDAAALISDDDDDDDEGASRSWEADDQRRIEVELRPANDKDVPIDDYIDAINSCDAIETLLNGLDATVTLAAEPLDAGDEAVKLVMTVEFEVLGPAGAMEVHGYMFRRDGIAAQVSAMSGLIQSGADEFELVDADLDVAEDLVADIDEAIQAG